MSRLVLFAAAATLAAGAAHAQRVEVDPARKTTSDAPIAVRPGETIVSEISASDASPMPLFREEHFQFTGEAGETITVRAATEIMMLLVIFQDDKRREIARGMATDAPLKVVLPRDGTYRMVVTSGGSRRYGKYELSFQSSAVRPAPVQVAEAPAAPEPLPPTPAAPLREPELPVIPGVVGIRSGQTLSRPAGKPGAGAEVFQFIAGAGSRLSATVTGAGPIVATLYGPSGAALRSEDGMAILRLDAALPLDGLYFLSVARSDPTQPYKLALTATD